jgi:very-short-patch-repair endonuclease
MGRLFNRNYQSTRRKVIRKDLTQPEALLWKSLKQKKLEGRKFQKQQTIGNYTIEFYCPSENLAITLDYDGSLVTTDWKEDQQREKYLEEKGIKIIRIRNVEVIQSKDAVLDRIKQEFNYTNQT